MKTCPRCGVENKREKAACWNCWAPLDGPAGAAAAPKAATRTVSLAVPWTAVAVVALVLAAAAGAYFLLLRSEPADVAEQYLRAVRNGNEEKRDRLSSRDTSGQSVLPQRLMIAEYEVQRDGVIVSDKQAEVPASVQLTLDPAVGLTQPILVDLAVKHLKKHPVRANMVLAKEGFSWRVDQQQTQMRFTAAVMRDVPPVIEGQIKALLSGRMTAVPAPGASGGEATAGQGLAKPGAAGRPGMGKAGLPGRPRPGGGAPTKPGRSGAGLGGGA